MNNVWHPYAFRLMEKSDLYQVMAVDWRSGLIPWPEHSFLDELGNILAEYLVLVQNDSENRESAVVGFAGQWFVAGEAQLMKIAIDPDFQGNGLGRRLMKKIIARARSHNCQSITLEVRTDNEPALGLYRSFGFEILGKRERYYPNGADAYVMELVFPDDQGDRISHEDIIN
ncbi:ribosomal protein S18-alanine N-acetyltransferase [Pseudoramibacter porci]|uniref:Ribosomal-protein-alanine N-acetyltransferase n=1 Tax=Pseudoramibacter porci TaxID=2606631 RepID=A0A7X2NEK2_9FIRM|nr:ribosomal protein S18-alanine N-acetyltransferase [Pseudoramibacter porci]MSS19122.1 ribosomal-protein-alanine N-acetyltransferase [Pseudoramibacter porci]